MKNKYIIFIVVVFSVLGYIFMYEDKHKLKTTINNSISIKISEKHLKVEDKNVFINCRMPIINYEDKDIERYINSLIRKDINNIMNIEKQKTKLDKINKNMNVVYHIPFRNSDIINIVLQVEIILNDKVSLSEYSYIFDLKSGQRVFLNHFLDEKVYSQIEKYIYEHYKSSENFKIDNFTDYKISNGGIEIFSNTNLNKLYFKVPYSVFENYTKEIECRKIDSNIDTQILTKDDDYFSSLLNIPIITTENTKFNNYINKKITDDIMSYYELLKEESISYNNDVIYGGSKIIKNIDFEIKKNYSDFLSIVLIENDLIEKRIFKSYNIDILNNEFLEIKDLFEIGVYEKFIKNELVNNEIDTNNFNFYLQDDEIVFFDKNHCTNIYKIKVESIYNMVKDKYLSVLN